MMRPVLFAMFAGLALAAAGQTASAQRQAVRPNACASPPALALLPGFSDPRRRFALGTAAFRATVRNFEVAWRRSCANRLLRGVAWQRVFLRNAPDANGASLYRDPDARSRLTLEYPFLTGRGAAHVPTADELAEAIYCHVRGATPQEQEASGRCLPD